MKTAAFITIVVRNVESYASRVRRNVSGSVAITNAPNYAASCAIGQDVISPARNVSRVESGIIVIDVVVCVESLVFALYARKTTKQFPSPNFFLGSEDEKDALFIQLPDCKHIFAVKDLDRYYRLIYLDNVVPLQYRPQRNKPNCSH